MTFNRRLTAAVVAGALLGASLMLVYQGREINQLRVQYNSCTTEKETLEDQVRLLSAKLQHPNPEPVIESIQVDAKAPDGLTQLEVVDFVKKQLAFLVDRPLSTLDHNPDLPYRLLDGRTVAIDQQEFTIRVNTVVVAKKLFVAVTVSPSG
ncbi:MAG: hypothetical protein K6T81_10205 [Alicyclobacillus macrosporangiidus]|uniref:hypothetical protein n=1 Tax=Alicyclobacillus macrosporangiidus TaxID=392015 RepID=UPI0026EAF240|nr:hypothetical protein [Alicyclobacillus macrosporangiidus]MCL6599099.1 hypothetical protein [Alicyclobacillus macrosporangiidus]